MAKNLPEIKLKLLLIGDSSVGKTSILLNYTENYFPESHLSTIGVEYKVKQITTDKFRIILQVWDTAGQERFRSITKSFFRNTDGIFFVYDITNRKSFNSVKDWIKGAESNYNKFEKILVGNKIDLESERQVKREELEDFGGKKKIQVVETSAKEKTNIDDAFQMMVDLILKDKTDSQIISEFGSKTNNNTCATKTPAKKGSCCNN